MSLINDMLNDLDQRRLNVANVQDLGLFSVSKSDVTSSRRAGPVIIVLLLTGLIAGAYTPYGQNLWRSVTGLASVELAAKSITLPAEKVIAEKIVSEPDIAKVVNQPAAEPAIPRHDTRQLVMAMDAEPELIEQQAVAVAKLQDTRNPQSEQISQIGEQPSVRSATADQQAAVSAEPIDEPIPNKVKPALTAKKDLPVIRKVRSLTLAQRDEQTVEQARHLIQSGQVNEAQQLLQTVIAEYPEALQSQQLLISQLLIAQQLEQAGKVLTAAQQKHGDNLELIKLNARLHIAKGEHEQALSLLQSRDTSVWADVEARELAAALAQQLGHYSQAVAAYRSLVEHDPGRANWWIGLAIALEASGEQLEAKAAYQRGTSQAKLAPELRQYAMQRLATL